MRVIALCLLLAGCSVFDAPRKPKHKEVAFTVRLTEDLPKGIYGMIWCSTDGIICRIDMRESTYPYCLTHEIRHAFEGNFHAGTTSVEDCE